VHELLAPGLVGGDPPRNMSDHFFASAKRRSARLFFFAARSSRDAGRSSSLLRGLEQLGVVVVVAEERERLGRDRRGLLVGVVVPADLDEALLALELDGPVLRVELADSHAETSSRGT
jgi:hypothetical protein